MNIEQPLPVRVEGYPEVWLNDTLLLMSYKRSVKYSLIIQKINFPLFVIFIRRSIKKKRTKGRLLFDNHVVVYVQIRDV